MNIVKTGTMIRIFDSSVETGDKIQPGVYNVRCQKMIGFFLEEAKVTPVTEKVYGGHEAKLAKVISSYEKTERNLGVILSGDKGIGKTLFTRLAMAEMVKRGYPVLIVNESYGGLSEFIGSIEQPCVVVFDEFDKNFFINDSDAVDKTAVQNQMLTLFDGVIPGHKLFIITCNDLGRVSSYLVNRPGRFRYHIRFGYPKEEDVRQYLRDNVGDKLKKDDEDCVAKFAMLVPQSYDCLNAIASELANGESFASAMDMLNIVNIAGDKDYNISVIFADPSGKTCKATVAWGWRMDIFAEDGGVQRLSLDPQSSEMCRTFGLGDDNTFSSEKVGISPDIGYLSFNEASVRKYAKFENDCLILTEGFSVTPRNFDGGDGKHPIVKYCKALHDKGVKVAAVVLRRSDSYATTVRRYADVMKDM